MNIMKMELAASGLSEEEILAKAQLLMKAFGKEDAASTAEYKLLSKQKNKALVKAEIPPKDFSAVSNSSSCIEINPSLVLTLLLMCSTIVDSLSLIMSGSVMSSVCYSEEFLSSSEFDFLMESCLNS